MKHSIVRSSVALLVLGIVTACGSSKFDSQPEYVGAKASALTLANTPTPLTELTGTYTNCATRTGNWSARVDGYAGALTFQELTVAKNDTACQLTLNDARTATEIHRARNIDQATDTATLAPQGPLGLSYATPIRGYSRDTWPAWADFYATAKLSAITFASDFTITFLYSDDADEVTATVASQAAYVTGTAVSERVPAPEYTIDTSGVVLYRNITTTPNRVDSVSGTVSLTATGQTAEEWVITAGTDFTEWSELDFTFTQGVQRSGTVTGSPLVIDATDFINWIGDPLPMKRTLILKHSSPEGVPSYQYFTITFN